MSVGKFTSLEEVRKDPKLLKQFIKERVKDGQGEGDEAQFEAALGSILKSSPEADPASPKVSDADYSGTQTRPDTSADASAKPKRGFRE
jgi:hypothetical protein